MSRRPRPGKWAADKRYLRGEFENQPCAVEDCRAFRYRSRYCKKHRTYATQNGSPYVVSKIIQKRFMRKEYREVRTFLKRNLTHPAVAAGLMFIETWLYNDNVGMDDINAGKVDQHIARLRNAGVEPMAILVELCALYLFSRRQSWVPDGRVLTYSMSNAVLSLATIRQYAPAGTRRCTTRAGRVDGSHRRIVGETLRTALAPLLMNVASAVMQKAMETKEQRADIRQPFPRDPATGKFAKRKAPTEGN